MRFLCSQNLLVLETSILPSPSSLPPWLTPTTVTSYYQDFSQTPPHRRFIKISLRMTPHQEPKNKMKFLSTSNAHSLKATTFHTMAFILSLEIINNETNDSTRRSWVLRSCIMYAKSKRSKSISNSMVAFVWTAQKSPFVKSYRTRFLS